MEMGRQSGTHLGLHHSQIAGVDLRLIEVDRQADGLTLEARQRSHDRGRGGVAVEHVAGAARDDLGPETAQHDRSLAVRDVHRGCDLVELPFQGGVVDLGRRRDVCSEEAQVEPAEAAQGAEAVALAADGVDGGAPVHADPEVPGLQPPRPRADAEGHRDRGERVRPAFEDGSSLMRRLPAHVDARDPDAVGEPRGRARKGEPEHHRSEADKRREDCGSLPEQTALGARPATSPGTRPDHGVFAPSRQGCEV